MLSCKKRRQTRGYVAYLWAPRKYQAVAETRHDLQPVGRPVRVDPMTEIADLTLLPQDGIENNLCQLTVV
jgi:hypothetical protein